MAIKKTLECGFITAKGGKVTIRLSNPRSNLDGEGVAQTMANIVGRNALQDNKEELVTATDYARLITTNEQYLFGGPEA